ncbi:MAG: BlaI/MecI/CopY family transcriptional regulator [Peptostreptococcaceae bacterium]
MTRETRVTESELEVLKVLWNLEKATTNEIVSELSNKTFWNPRTIQTLISRLSKKEILGIEKINKKTYMYYPLITEEDYKNYANNSLLDKLYNGSLNLMMSTFIKNTNLSEHDIDQLKKLLDER